MPYLNMKLKKYKEGPNIDQFKTAIDIRGVVYLKIHPKQETYIF